MAKAATSGIEIVLTLGPAGDEETLTRDVLASECPSRGDAVRVDGKLWIVKAVRWVESKPGLLKREIELRPPTTGAAKAKAAPRVRYL